jgi:Sulfatase
MSKAYALYACFILLMASCVPKQETSETTASSIIPGEILPFPEPPSASTVGESIFDSKHQRRQHPSHLPANSPNIVIVLMDDLGFGTPSTFGGEINTPTLSKVYEQGIGFNEFHTTAICSPTRASLLTGRNHTRVGNGTIAERATDWDGYSGIIPKEAATIAEAHPHMVNGIIHQPIKLLLQGLSNIGQ